MSWAIRKQAEADHGEATPDAAVNVYVLKMSSGERLGLSRVLAPSRRDELLQQWRQYRGEMERANVPSKLETVGPIDVEDQGHDRATVTAQVRPTWWHEQTNLSGRRRAGERGVRSAQGGSVGQGASSSRPAARIREVTKVRQNPRGVRRRVAESGQAPRGEVAGTTSPRRLSG